MLSLALPETIHLAELSAAKVSVSLFIDLLLLHVSLAVSVTAENFCDNSPAAAKYVLVLLSLFVTSLLPPPPGASTLLISVN